jgi:hypothetical protein
VYPIGFGFQPYGNRLSTGYSNSNSSGYRPDNLLGFGTPSVLFGSSDLKSGFEGSSMSFGWDPGEALRAASAGSCQQEEEVTPSELTTAIPEDAETVRLRTELLQAPPAKREELLQKLRDGKSAACTTALATAVPRLVGAVRQQVHDTLVERLNRLPTVALRLKLDDANAEVRSAAARACALKQDTKQVSDLIARLETERDEQALESVGAALKALTSRELYLTADADRETRVQMARKWREWWSAQDGKHAAQ